MRDAQLKGTLPLLERPPRSVGGRRAAAAVTLPLPSSATSQARDGTAASPRRTAPVTDTVGATPKRLRLEQHDPWTTGPRYLDMTAYWQSGSGIPRVWIISPVARRAELT